MQKVIRRRMPMIPGLSVHFNASKKDSIISYKAGNAGHSKECHFIFSKQLPLTTARDTKHTTVDSFCIEFINTSLNANVAMFRLNLPSMHTVNFSSLGTFS